MKDEVLVIKSLEGDNEAFSELVSRYLKIIKNFSFRFTKDNDIAEEIAQETFLKVWKNLPKFKTNQSFKAWIFSIAKNTAIDFLRKNKEVLLSEFENEDGINFLIENFASEEGLPSDIFFQSEQSNYLFSLVKNLPEKYKEVVTLYYKENLDLKEISKFLNRPLNTVKSQLLRGIKLLRQNMHPNFEF